MLLVKNIFLLTNLLHRCLSQYFRFALSDLIIKILLFFVFFLYNLIEYFLNKTKEVNNLDLCHLICAQSHYN